MGHVYPILVDVAKRRIVIVGGGKVAARKARGLIEAGADSIFVISPQFVADFPVAVHKVAEAYEPRHLDGALLVFAATNKADVNSQIVRDCHERNILVNRADVDDEMPGDFVTPAKYQENSVMVTVSAASAALAASIRDALQRRWDPKWSKMADAMQMLRPWIRSQSHLPQSARAAVFKDLATPEAMDVLDRAGPDALRAWLKAKHPELHDA